MHTIIFLIFQLLLLTSANQCTFRNSSIDSEFYLIMNATINCTDTKYFTCSHNFSGNASCPRSYVWDNNITEFCDNDCCITGDLFKNQHTIGFACVCPMGYIDMKFDKTLIISTGACLPPDPSMPIYGWVLIAVLIACIATPGAIACISGSVQARVHEERQQQIRTSEIVGYRAATHAIN